MKIFFCNKIFHRKTFTMNGKKKLLVKNRLQCVFIFSGCWWRVGGPNSDAWQFWQRLWAAWDALMNVRLTVLEREWKRVELNWVKANWVCVWAKVVEAKCIHYSINLIKHFPLNFSLTLNDDSLVNNWLEATTLTAFFLSLTSSPSFSSQQPKAHNSYHYGTLSKNILIRIGYCVSVWVDGEEGIESSL